MSHQTPHMDRAASTTYAPALIQEESVAEFPQPQSVPDPNGQCPPEMTTTEWKACLKNLSLLLFDIVEVKASTYKRSRETASRLLKQRAEEFLPFPVVSDTQALALLAVVDDITGSKSAQDPENAELILTSGRHLSEHLADLLLDRHMRCLDQVLKEERKALPHLISRLDGADPHLIRMPSARLVERVTIYRSTRSFLHPPELSLSVRKIRTRASARARRGNLWPKERKKKTLFLEMLADEGRIHPSFTEEDLLFLVSQSSMKMLQRKVDLLESEGQWITPNYLKANFSRLMAHIEREKSRRSDFERRKDLLRKLGASPKQIEYISARASYQTMENLAHLSNGEFAISDLMGGRRAITKILRRQGRILSEAEMALARYLIEEEHIRSDVAQAYAQSRKNHSLEHLKKTLDFLKEQYRNHYQSHWGFEIQPEALRRALELGLSRRRLGKRALSRRDYLHDLRTAVSEEEYEAVREYGSLTEEERRQALEPLREVIEYEVDSATKKQLFFIYEQFIKYGLCMSREQLKRICLGNRHLFSSPRRVQDALEILNGSYGAVAQRGAEICISTDYLSLHR